MDTKLKVIHDLSGNILDCTNKIKSIEYRLELLDKSTSFSAKTFIEIGGRRTSTIEWLTQDEIKMILNRRIEEEKTKLEKFETEYKKHSL